MAVSTTVTPEQIRDYFLGHALPAIWFITSGLWWAYNEFLAHARSLATDDHFRHYHHHVAPSYRTRIWYPGPYFQRLPIESLLRAVLMSLGAVHQVITCCFLLHERPHSERLQHSVIFAGFALSGSVDMISAMGHRLLLPPGAVRSATVLSYGIFVLVFGAHSRSGVRVTVLEIHMHQYYCYAATGVVLALLADALLDSRHLALALTRSFFQVVLGLVSLQIGFTLYFPGGAPSWWPRTGWLQGETESGVSVASAVMCSHLLLTLVLMLVMGGVVSRAELGSGGWSRLAIKTGDWMDKHSKTNEDIDDRDGEICTNEDARLI